jgi:predicted MFS family arabinose efflux permease
LWADIAEGLSWLWNQPLIRAMAFLATMGWVALSAETLLVIVLARQHHASAATIGLMFATGGAGGVVGSILAGRVRRFLTFGQVVIGFTWLLSALWSLYAVAPTLISIAAIHAVIWLLFPIFNVVQMGYRLAIVPDVLQGRVNSVFRLIAFTGQPVGLALSGIMLQALGPTSTVLILLASPLAMAVSASLNRHVRHARPATEARAA